MTMQRYLILLKGEPDGEAAGCKDLPKMVELTDRLRRDGVLLAAEELLPSRTGVRVRQGEAAVVDGPFAEAKELVGGFVIVRTPDRAGAVDVARQILRLAFAGTTAEVREIAG